ncbi:hypothetical protein FRB94_003501 [Tulasnella sp. JGI-2019a]|nr:hypothetical protein FRB94_003501 [Tulasnella sp. JGI-2019a]
MIQSAYPPQERFNLFTAVIRGARMYSLPLDWALNATSLDYDGKRVVVTCVLGMDLSREQQLWFMSGVTRITTTYPNPGGVNWLTLGDPLEAASYTSPGDRLNAFRDLNSEAADGVVEGVIWALILYGFTLEQATELMEVLALSGEPTDNSLLLGSSPEPQVEDPPKNARDVQARFSQLAWGQQSNPSLPPMKEQFRELWNDLRTRTIKEAISSMRQFHAQAPKAIPESIN